MKTVDIYIAIAVIGIMFSLWYTEREPDICEIYIKEEKLSCKNIERGYNQVIRVCKEEER